MHLDAELIAKSISGETSFCLSNLINGSLDADKMDYLARDNYFSMAPNYLMIFDRIYRLAEFQPCGAEGKITMVFSEKAISAIMKIILSRTFEYNDIINHPVQLCFQGLFFACIEKIMDHHAPEEQSDILKRLELMNDDQLLHALSILGDGDQLIQNLLYAIKYRELYKKAEIYTKTEMQEVITLLGKSEAESIFLDHYNIEHFLKDFEQDSPDLKDFVNLAKELQNTNSGILFFYNKDNPAFHKILQKVLIIKESDGNIMSLKDYLHDKAKGNGKFINNPSTRDDDIDTALSILDIFNVIDDRCYIYCDKRVIGHVQTVLKKFFNHGGVSNFLLYCIKDSIDTTSAK